MDTLRDVLLWVRRGERGARGDRDVGAQQGPRAAVMGAEGGEGAWEGLRRVLFGREKGD